jgi:hypothetical protein
MKKFLVAALCALGTTAAFANPTPQLTLSLHLVGDKLNDANYVIDADACSYTSNVCNDNNHGTMHDHESHAFDKGWTDWLPNWQTLSDHYQLVSYHISIRHPESGRDVVACGLNDMLPADVTKASLYVFERDNKLHCWLLH